MSTIRIALFSLCLTACAAVSGQQMYKTVGPDGKVTFSDRPQLETARHLSVMRSNTLRPVETPAAPVAAQTPPEVRAAPAAAPVLTITPQIEASILAVMVQSEFSRRHYHFCNSTQAGARAFNLAASGWRHRNYPVIEQQRKLVMQMVSPGKRSELLGNSSLLLRDAVAKVSALSPEERARWCKEAITMMNDKGSDMQQPEMMAVVVQPYKK